jgi:S-DNA-T family DNA segregation ATPase FtsK/SpoIIIE
MSAAADGPLRLAISVERAGSDRRRVEVTTPASARTGDVIDALAAHLGLPDAKGAALAQSLLSGHWLDRELSVGASGILRGEQLSVSVGLQPPVPPQPLTRWANAPRPADARGCVQVFRPPRTLGDEQPTSYRLRARPEPSVKRRFPLGAMLIPLVIGLVLYVVTRRIEIVLFSLFSPVMMLWNVVEDRRARKADLASGARSYAEELLAIESRARARTEQWAAWIQHDHPAPEVVVQTITALGPRVWERRPGDADFLRLRLGTAVRTAPAEIRRDGTSAEDIDAEQRIRSALRVTDLPLTASLQQDGSLAVLGAAADRADIARWLVIQLCALHSPRDLQLAAIVPDADADWDWCRWLPHVAEADLPVPALASGHDDAATLLGAVAELVRTRQDELSPRARQATAEPAVLVVFVDGTAVAVPAVLGRILDGGPEVGVHVIWLGADPRLVPGQIAMSFQLSGGAPSDRGAVLVDHRAGLRTALSADRLGGAQAAKAAAALAPLVDAAMEARTRALPERVLLEELQPELDSPGARRRAWLSAPAAQLWARLGVSADGPVAIDMGPDGSHALVGGTTGSGKSELLQTMVASLAAQYPPDRVAFLLVDYKGGAAFKDAVRLPHTVGLVTDLDRHLTRRVLLALDAEIKRRERLLGDADARDLLELRTRWPDRAPEELLVIVDEFATLAKEVPEFVEGMVDIAARGRSLGLRLVLATQRPAGVISERIRANVGVRIALRVNDESDSLDVIDSPAAAHISRTTPGRAYLRVNRDVVEFQSAYVGAPVIGADAAITVRALEGRRVPSEPAGPARDGRSALEALVDGTDKVMRLGRWRRPHVPWLPALPDLVELTARWDAPDDPVPPGTVILGLADQPERQRQRLVALDFDHHQHVLVYGTSRSGKTTTLRTIAAGLVHAYPPTDAHLYALDFAGQGLQSLTHAPHCGAVITAADPGRIARLLGLLRRTVDERRRKLTSSGCTGYAELRQARPDEALPRIVVLLDSYSGAGAALERVDGGRLLEQLQRLIAEGAAAGVHFVITADRRAAVPSSITSIVTTRIVLRMAERDDYALLGVDAPTIGDGHLPPGRGLIAGSVELQVAVLSDEASGRSQGEAFAALGEQARSMAGGEPARQIGTMPLESARTELPTATRTLLAPLGIGADELLPWLADLRDGNFLVTGPRRSGRTTALATLALGLHGGPEPPALVLVAPRRSPLHELDIWRHRVAETHDPAPVEAALAGSDELLRAGRALVLVCDDADEYSDPLSAALERQALRGREAPLRVIAASDNRAALRSYAGLLPEVRRGKQGLLLAPEVDVDGDILGVRLRASVESMSGPGRGFAVHNGVFELVQVAR